MEETPVDYDAGQHADVVGRGEVFVDDGVAHFGDELADFQVEVDLLEDELEGLGELRLLVHVHDLVQAADHLQGQAREKRRRFVSCKLKKF